MKYGCRTRFDITNTGVTGHYKSSRVPFRDLSGKEILDESSWNRARNQQRNWETLTQLIGLRAQISDSTLPTRTGNNWTFEFSVETADVYGTAEDATAILRGDSEGVPMLIDLENEPGIDPVLIVAGDQQNIWFWSQQ
jgi:hypothetical protein